MLFEEPLDFRPRPIAVIRQCLDHYGDTARPVAFVQRFFNGKVEKPFTAGRHVADALASLPAKRNAVVLIDPAGLLPLFGPMMGLTATDAIPLGPPIAISASLAGEPARLDIHVPLRATDLCSFTRASVHRVIYIRLGAAPSGDLSLAQRANDAVVHVGIVHVQK